MIILGFDPSLTDFGWAVHDTEATGEDKCLARGRFRTSSKQLLVDRFCYMRQSVIDCIYEHGPDKIGLESPAYGGRKSETMFALWLFTSEGIKETCHDVALFTPLQVKAAARKMGDFPEKFVMDKGSMSLASQKFTSSKKKWNHNEADAFWVAVLAGRFWNFFNGNLPSDDLDERETRLFTRHHVVTKGKNKGKVEATGLIHRENDRFFLWSRE